MAPPAQIAAIAMAPDASWAITVSADGTVRTWGDGTVPRLIRRAVPVDDGQPVAVALVGDRVRVLWASGNTIRLYENVRGGWPRHAEFPVPATVRALALSPSGALGVAACDDGTLWILAAGTGDFAPPVATGGQTARAVAVATDRGPVAAIFPDGSVRRFDIDTGTSELVASCPDADLVAVTPDGRTVVTDSADGRAIRWPSGAGSGAYLGPVTTITAIAVDLTGATVLAGGADGTLRRHDMTGGPIVEFGTARAPSPPPAPPASVGSAAPWAPTEHSVDEDVRFTVYRPQTISPGTWASLLVFAHKTDLVEQPGQPPLDPNERVEAIARAHFGNNPVRQVGEDARSGVLRGARLRITADLPGLLCNPASAEFDWWEPVHHVEFRLMAAPGLAGSVVRGAVRIWCGPLILGEVSLAISITTAPPTVPLPAVAESAPRYRKIFPSYSHADGAIVDGFAEVVRVFGDEYLRDVIALRSGERWRERLPELIEEADVFQLFWSSNSMRSPYCREEWEHALSLGRPFFVRPFYWEDPRPEDRVHGLPPAALDALQFVKVSLRVARREQPGSPVPGPDYGAGAGTGKPGYAPPLEVGSTSAAELFIVIVPADQARRDAPAPRARRGKRQLEGGLRTGTLGTRPTVAVAATVLVAVVVLVVIVVLLHG